MPYCQQHHHLILIPTIQVWSPLTCSLLDQVSEPKETQLSMVLPYSAGPAELSVPEPVVQVS